MWYSIMSLVREAVARYQFEPRSLATALMLHYRRAVRGCNRGQPLHR